MKIFQLGGIIMQTESPGTTRTVKAEILLFVLPIVIIGLGVLSGVIFKYMGSAFEEQLVSGAVKNSQEVSESVSEWLDKRMLETRLAASHPAARALTPDLMNKNNEYRLALMEKAYPGVYDSVSGDPSTVPASFTVRPRAASRKCTTATRLGTKRP